MKKFLLATICALISISASAQLTEVVITSKTTTKEIKEKKKTRYLRYGFNIMNFTGDYWESDPRLGYELLYGMQRRMKHGVYYNLEAGLSSRGYSDPNQKLIAHNIKFEPLAFGYKYTFEKGVGLDLHVGAGISIDYTGRVKNTGGDSFSIWDIEDDYIPADVYLKVGAGVWYKHFNFDLSFQPSLIPALNFDVNGFSDELEVKSTMVTLGVSYVF